MSIRIYYIVVAIVVLSVGHGLGADSDPALINRIDSYLEPYVQSGNFSGAVLVSKEGKILLEKAYGLADRERKAPNEKTTRFHIASVSMQFTATAVLRLVDKGALRLNDSVGAYSVGITGAERITVRDLLTEKSGLPDINSFSDYGNILAAHQTPSTLVSQLQGHSLLFEPGTKFLHEEHSAYNLLALIVEKKTGLDFRRAMNQLVFQPAGMKSSGVDDDSVAGVEMAKGYQPEGLIGLKAATQVHWSAKSGNGSGYTTVADEARFVEQLFQGRLLGETSQQTLLEASPRVGYGWFRGRNERFDQIAFYMNGRAPGYASFVVYFPRERMTVVVLSNIYSSATTSIGYDVAAISQGLPYVAFHPLSPVASRGENQSQTGNFRFGPDFYQPNALISITANNGELSLRWPDGSSSPLIPIDRDRFIDRSYWEAVALERDNTGHPQVLTYGEFRGKAMGSEP